MKQTTETQDRFFLGVCDVCGKAIAFRHDREKQGIIDFWPSEGGYTYIRHYAKAPANANPDCDLYSSKVFLVKELPEGLEAKLLAVLSNKEDK